MSVTCPLCHRVCASLAYFANFELYERLSPSGEDSSAGYSRFSTTNQQSPHEPLPLWEKISEIVDGWEAWRNPNTSVETISTAVGTNRIYVARCIKEHTGLTVNDYINQKRVDYMASELKKASLSHKEIYFSAGFRSRQTAYRNFLKFKGVSPTDYMAALESQS